MLSYCADPIRISNVDSDRQNQKEKFSAEKFLENLLVNGEQAACDETSPCFKRFCLPDYYDEKMYKRGQRFFYKNIFGLFLGKLLGLIAVLSQKRTLAILVMTNLSSSDMTAYRRYVATILHMLIWYDDDFRPNSKLWKSLAAVNHFHNSASTRASKKLLYRINQKDMALTQFGFMGFALARGEMIGVHNPSHDELKGFIHLWRTVGYLLGIEEQYNICKESVEETKAICNELLEKVLRPSVKEKNPKVMEMSSYLIQGLWCTNPFLEHRVFMFYLESVVENNISNISVDNSEFNLLKSREKFKLKLMIGCLKWMRYTLVRTVLKYLQLLGIFLTKYLPYLAIYKFGWKKSFVKVP